MNDEDMIYSITLCGDMQGFWKPINATDIVFNSTPLEELPYLIKLNVSEDVFRQFFMASENMQSIEIDLTDCIIK